MPLGIGYGPGGTLNSSALQRTSPAQASRPAEEGQAQNSRSNESRPQAASSGVTYEGSLTPTLGQNINFLA